MSVELPTASPMAARAGARTAVVGGVGDEDSGRWARGQLELAGVGLGHFKLIENMPRT